MTPCDYHLGGYPDGLCCTRTDVHTTHQFESTSGDVRGQEKSDGGGDGE